MIVLKCDICHKPYNGHGGFRRGKDFIKNKDNYAHRKCEIKKEQEEEAKQAKKDRNHKPKETGKYIKLYPPYPQEPDTEAGRKYPIVGEIRTTAQTQALSGIMVGNSNNSSRR